MLSHHVETSQLIQLVPIVILKSLFRLPLIAKRSARDEVADLQSKLVDWFVHDGNIVNGFSRFFFENSTLISNNFAFACSPQITTGKTCFSNWQLRNWWFNYFKLWTLIFIALNMPKNFTLLNHKFDCMIELICFPIKIYWLIFNAPESNWSNPEWREMKDLRYWLQ